MAIETKERILDAAERLFADFGYKATSLRDITGEAGVNLASVNYHFGSKDALLTALLERRFEPVNRRRLELLDQLEESADGKVDVQEIVRAFLSPPFELHWGEGGRGGGRSFVWLEDSFRDRRCPRRIPHPIRTDHVSVHDGVSEGATPPRGR